MQLKGLIIIFFALSFVSTDLIGQRKIQWRTWDEVQELNKKEKRKIFVDIYTSWCGWCKKMDKATFQQDHIAKYINENYYAVKFDAEHKADILFNGNTYKYVKSGRKGYNELAAEITRGKLSYPTIVFLDEEQKVLQPIPGFQGPDVFEMIMTYFAEDHFKKTPWNRYTATYKKAPTNGIPVVNK